jgi:5-methylcytosine-specific restriction endonuclease McrA
VGRLGRWAVLVRPFQPGRPTAGQERAVSHHARRHKIPVAHIQVDGKALTYGQYMNSSAWQAKRKQAIIRACGKCQLCGWRPNKSAQGFNVHHNTYDHIGAEWESDLIVLCKECHDIFHKHRKHARRREKRTYFGPYAWKPRTGDTPIDHQLDAEFSAALSAD